MQTNILWSGIEYHSMENCLVTISGAGTIIHSTIIGSYQEQIYHVTYHIQTNRNWETLSFEIKSRVNDHQEHWQLDSDGKGNWTQKGMPEDQFKGCIDIDIPLTPFTNTLPINRLKLQNGEEQKIKVIYLDILEATIKPVRQKYTRLSPAVYHYENIPNDFEANITVDDQGFVVDYPGLFIRTALMGNE